MYARMMKSISFLFLLLFVPGICSKLPACRRERG